MADLFDYLHWRGDLSFESIALNDIDAIILSRLSYLPFDGIVPSELDGGISIERACELFFADENASKKLLWKGDAELLYTLSQCERFKNLTLCGYVNTIEEKEEMQFSATIIRLRKDLSFISFRGTDNSVIGWQEDFNMYCMFPLPSQKRAVSYLKSAADASDGGIILGGHSKGGNMAVYSAYESGKEIKDRIISIYNLDGPGFDKTALDTGKFKSIKEKIRTFVPQSSVFGMMFEHQEDYTIVKSNQKGFMQHDIYSWEIEVTSPVTLGSLTRTSAFFDRTLTDFAESLSLEERKEFIGAIFDLLKSTEDKTFNEIADNWRKNSGVFLKSIKNADAKSRAVIISSLLGFIKSAMNNFSELNPLSKENRLKSIHN